MCDFSSDEEEPVARPVRSAEAQSTETRSAERLVQSTLKGGVAREEGPRRAEESQFPGKQKSFRQIKLV